MQQTPAIDVALDTNAGIPNAAEAARTVLLELPGCRNGQAIASTILTAGAPKRMAVYDDRALHGLDQLGCPDPQGRYSSYMTTVCYLLDAVHREEDPTWLARDIDKALYILGGQERNQDFR